VSGVAQASLDAKSTIQTALNNAKPTAIARFRVMVVAGSGGGFVRADHRAELFGLLHSCAGRWGAEVRRRAISWLA